MGPEESGLAKCKMYYDTGDGYRLVSEDRFEAVQDSVDKDYPIVTGYLTGDFVPMTFDFALHLRWWEKAVFAFYRWCTERRIKVTQWIITRAARRL